MRGIHFLAGLPRSGSTTLGALLCQRPDVHVSATSSLIDTMGSAAITWESSPQVRAGDASLAGIYPMLGAMVEAHYKDVDKVVIDKSRGWSAPKVMATMAKVLGRKPKIIATVRPVAECLASFMKIAKWDGVPKDFIDKSPLAGHLFYAYSTLREGFEADSDNFLFVEYDDLVRDPQASCDRVADFLELPRFAHTFEGLSNPVPEKDAETWGVPGLHDVRSTVSKQQYSAKELLGDKLFNFYQGGEFWKPDFTEVQPKKKIIDLQLAASLRGDFERGWKLCERADEADDRAMFNKGWYLLWRGELSKGMRHLDRGRAERVFGNPAPSNQPRWDGRKLNGEFVLLNSEGGIGDEIINARFARDIAARGGRVILSCDPSVAPILAQISGVSAVVQRGGGGAVYHSYWAPAMSVAGILGLEYRDLDGSPYLPCPKLPPTPRMRVGIRWAGNPQFEHEQYRRFPHEWMFNLGGVDLVSLQDKWTDPIPDHVLQPTLDDWERTVAEIAKCDLIISSCTAVAHLAAAMGKPTWVIAPVLPYYVWALPGDTSPWYKTVRLFRQEKFGEWNSTLRRVASALRATLRENKRIEHG